MNKRVHGLARNQRLKKAIRQGFSGTIVDSNTPHGNSLIQHNHLQPGIFDLNYRFGKKVGTAQSAQPHLDSPHVVGQMLTIPPDLVDLGDTLVHRQLASQVRTVLVPEAATKQVARRGAAQEIKRCRRGRGPVDVAIGQACHSCAEPKASATRTCYRQRTKIHHPKKKPSCAPVNTAWRQGAS